MKRRDFIKHTGASTLAMCFAPYLQAQEPKPGTKILVVYYSWGGNTRVMAHMIHKLTGSDIFEVKPVKPYPTDYDSCVTQAKQEIREHFRPEIGSDVNKLAQYDLIFVGTPNWWSTLAPPLATFLAKHDFSGKTIIPFCTHGGGGEAHVFTDIAQLTPGAKQLKGLAVPGNSVSSARPEIKKWLAEILPPLS